MWIQVLTPAFRRGAVRLVSGRMSRRVPSAAAAGAVCRRGPVRLLTGPWDAAAGIARRRAGGRPPPRQGPPASRRTPRRGPAAAAARPARWRGEDSPLTRPPGIARRRAGGRPVPCQGPPAPWRKSRWGPVAAAARAANVAAPGAGRWRGGENPLTRPSGIVRRTDFAPGPGRRHGNFIVPTSKNQKTH